MQGCTGGTFLTQDAPALSHWVQFDAPYFYVLFDRAPRERSQVPIWEPELDAYISQEERERETWWSWDDQLPVTWVRRPEWWSITTMQDARVGHHSNIPFRANLKLISTVGAYADNHHIFLLPRATRCLCPRG